MTVDQRTQTAADRLRARAYEEAGEWRATFQLVRQLGGLILCLLISSAASAVFSACATEQENGPDPTLILASSLRKVAAMLAKIDSLAQPERAASARFPEELRKAALDVQHLLFGAMVLLDTMMDRVDER